LSKISRHIVAGTRADSEQLMIPYTFSYGNEGQAKVDLNVKISSKDVNAIADTIKTNLPNWASIRRGGFPYQATPDTAKADDGYRRTIAANIIGYSQAASDPPVVGADYRGVGAYPLVNEFYDYINWTATSSDSITVQITSWVELWNMTNQTISGDVKYTDYYRHALNLGAFTYFDDNHDPDKPDPGESITGYPFPSQSVSMAPNEYKVLRFGPAIYTLSTGGTIPPSPLTLKSRTSGKYKLEWKSSGGSFVVVDQPLSGVQMQNDSIYNPQGTSSQVPYKWNGCLPGFQYYGGIANFYNNPGDPRSAYYNSAPQSANDYSSNATMWSRNQKPSSTVAVAKEMKVSAWPDGGHDTTLAKAGAKDTVPPSTTPPAGANTEPSKAPAVISNAGRLKSLAELGNIYDPAQWNIVPNSSNQWVQIDSNTVADSHYGGGLTLRIGRREFARFDKNGSRASDLLDIFGVGTRRETQGLINLNTATRETLRALAAGVILNRDPDIKAGTTPLPLNAPTTTDQADKFADAIIAGRNTQPFVSTRQLAQLQALDATGKPATDTNGNPIAFFGNPQEWDATQPTPPDRNWEWNDAGSEDYFSRIFDLTSVRSRNFRVFVSGQYVDPRLNDPVTGKPPKILSSAKKVYHVFIHPSRAADGTISSQKIDITYERDL
jgi:hypothetical protein